MKVKVALLDTETSNIRSVYYALIKTGFDVTIIKSSEFKDKYDGFIFPGIGSFRSVIENLKKGYRKHYKGSDTLNSLLCLFVLVCRYCLKVVMSLVLPKALV